MMQIKNLSNHIILIGFKHAGKTLIGRQLAKTINKKFLDLDKEYESNALQNILRLKPCVLALDDIGLSVLNQEIIKQHILLHVTAPRGVVFERIMINGRPAFFNPNEEPYESFIRLWNERDHIYKKLTHHTINNNGTIEQAVKEALASLGSSL